MWLANRGKSREYKLPPRAPAAWDSMEAVKTADDFVRGLPRNGEEAG